MNLKISKEKLSMVFFYILIFIDFIGQLKGNSTISLISTFCIILLSLTFRVDQFLLYMMASIPFFNILNYKMGTISMFYILIIIFIIKYYVSKNQQHYKIKTKTILIIFLMVFSIYNINAFETYIKWLLKLTPLILIYKEEKLYKDISKIITYLTISTIISSAMGYALMNSGAYIYISSYVWNAGEVTTRFSGLIGDSLVYSQLLLLVMAFNFIKIEKFNCHKNICVICIILLVMFGFLTYSKTFIILLVIVILYYLTYKLIQYVKNKKNYKFIVFCIICLVGIIVIVYYISKNTSNSMISSYITRFSAQDLLTGREYVYKRFINLWKENPQVILLGIGFEKYITPYQISSGMTIIYSHNIYIETISLFGFFVFTILLIWIIKAILTFLKNKGDTIYLLPIIILAISGMVLHGHLEFGYYFYVIMAMIFYNIGIREITEKRRRYE